MVGVLLMSAVCLSAPVEALQTEGAETVPSLVTVQPVLKAGYFADIVVFDPAAIQDHATFEKPQQFSTGVSHVMINGGVALSNGEPTGKATGRVVRGQGWKGWPDGGCRASAKDWPARS